MYRMLQVGNPFETYIARMQTFHMRPPRLKPRVRRSADYLFIGAVWCRMGFFFLSQVMSVWPFDDLFCGFAILEIMTGFIFMAFGSV